VHARGRCIIITNESELGGERRREEERGGEKGWEKVGRQTE